MDLRMAGLPMSTQTISEMENSEGKQDEREENTTNRQQARILEDRGVQKMNGTDTGFTSGGPQAGDRTISGPSVP